MWATLTTTPTACLVLLLTGQALLHQYMAHRTTRVQPVRQNIVVTSKIAAIHVSGSTIHVTFWAAKYARAPHPAAWDQEGVYFQSYYR